MHKGSFKDRFKALSFREKLVFFASGILIISTFLPWYQDIDRFRTGDMFLGITGPLYLAGILVLICGAMSFGYITLKLLGKDRPKLPMKESYMNLGAAGLSVLMLVLANSVFFHPKFGINLTEKSMGSGMMMAFVAAGMMFIGSLMAAGSKKTLEIDDAGHLEPLINVNEQRESGSLQNYLENQQINQQDVENLYQPDQHEQRQD